MFTRANGSTASKWYHRKRMEACPTKLANGFQFVCIYVVKSNTVTFQIVKFLRKWYVFVVSKHDSLLEIWASKTTCRKIEISERNLFGDILSISHTFHFPLNICICNNKWNSAKIRYDWIHWKYTTNASVTRPIANWNLCNSKIFFFFQ